MCKIFLPKTLVLLLLSIIFFSCKKSTNERPITPSDLSKISVGFISGFVVNTSGNVVESAIVKIGTTSVTTDKYGYFEIKNIQVSNSAGTITFIKIGYFSVTKTFSPSKDKGAFFRVMMLPENNIGTIEAVTGGSLTYEPGKLSSVYRGISVKISLPANAVEVASSGLLYKGKVSVNAEVSVAYELGLFYRKMPGDLRAADSTGKEKILNSYNMIFIEFTGSGGEVLQIAKNKKAVLTQVLPHNLVQSLPQIVPIWYFDDATGLWKQDGEAIHTGNTCEGEISHLGCLNFNTAAFNNVVKFDCAIVDNEGYPMPNVLIGIEPIPFQSNYLFTDASGYVSGIMPANAQVTLSVYRGNSLYYSQIIYNKSVSTSISDISLGTITVAANDLTILEGTVRDCNNDGLASDGYIMAGSQFGLIAGDNYRLNLQASERGKFRFNINYRGGTNFPAYIISTNNKTAHTSQQAIPFWNTGKQTIPDIQLCNQPEQEYLNYTVDGVNYSYNSPIDSFTQMGYFIDNFDPSQGERIIMSGGNYASKTRMSFEFDRKNVGVGRTQTMTHVFFFPLSKETSVIYPAELTITEYGNVGEFISGSFRVLAAEGWPSYTKYNLLGNFRIRRNQ